MPENGEVCHITDQLNFLFSNRTLINIEILNDKFKKFKNYDDLIGLLPLKIKEIKCKGKLIIFYFYVKDSVTKDVIQNKNYYLFSHLGMTGHYSLFFNEKKKKSNIKSFFHKKEHVHVKFTFEINRNYITDGKVSYPYNIKYLYYSDPWRWSNFEFITYYDLYKKRFNKIEKSIVGDWIIKKHEFINNFKKYKESKRRKVDNEICEVLVDQKTIISGIGNYLISEILYDADINPFKLTSKITTTEIIALFNSCKKIIINSYFCCGMSFSDYSDLNDEPGTYQNYLRVYRQTKTLKTKINYKFELKKLNNNISNIIIKYLGIKYEKVLSKKNKKDRTIYYVKSQIKI